MKEIKLNLDKQKKENMNALTVISIMIREIINKNTIRATDQLVGFIAGTTAAYEEDGTISRDQADAVIKKAIKQAELHEKYINSKNEDLREFRKGILKQD